ncbi:MAG: hypothetical protein DA328_01040, partial [Nitrososphaeraceae archaeon]|nr:hypothetical protein [Nitrososphaeraceae archaeon]
IKEQAEKDKIKRKRNEITPQQKQQALQLYSQYLDTIFPDSKVKDIVYRGKTENQTNKKSKELGIFFTDDKNAANIYAIKYKGDEFDDSIIQGVVNKFGLNPTIEQIKSEIAFFEKMGATKEQIEKDAKEFQKYILNNKGIAEQAIINIKNPKNLTVKDWFDNYDNSSSLKENSDGLLLKGGKQSDNRIYDAGENQIVVFEPEQIHILGSKQDIEGFKNWVSSTPQSTNVDENPNQTHIDKINAKYDAELKALGQSTSIQAEISSQEITQSEIKAKKAYIERRRQEELNQIELHHGGETKIDKIDKSKLGARDFGFYGLGLYFTNSFSSAKNYGKQVSSFLLKPGVKVVQVTKNIKNDFYRVTGDSSNLERLVDSGDLVKLTDGNFYIHPKYLIDNQFNRIREILKEFGLKREQISAYGDNYNWADRREYSEIYRDYAIEHNIVIKGLDTNLNNPDAMEYVIFSQEQIQTKEEINAKYDAELKALGQQQENLQKEENKRQEIKRQEEELNRLIAIEEAQKEQEKAAEAEAEKQQKLRDLHNDVSFSLEFFETAVKDLSFHIEDLVDLSEIELNIEKLKTKMHDINGLLREIEKTSINLAEAIKEPLEIETKVQFINNRNKLTIIIPKLEEILLKLEDSLNKALAKKKEIEDKREEQFNAEFNELRAVGEKVGTDNLPDDPEQLKEFRKVVIKRGKEIEAEIKKLQNKARTQKSKIDKDIVEAELALNGKKLDGQKQLLTAIDAKFSDLAAEKKKIKEKAKEVLESPNDYFNEHITPENDDYYYLTEEDEAETEEEITIEDFKELKRILANLDIEEGSHVLEYPDNTVTKTVDGFLTDGDGTRYDKVYYVRIKGEEKGDIYAVRETRTTGKYQILGLQRHDVNININELDKESVSFGHNETKKKNLLNTSVQLQSPYKLATARKLTFAYSKELNEVNLSDIRKKFEEGLSLTPEQAENLHIRFFLPTTNEENELTKMGLPDMNYTFNKGFPYLIISNIYKTYKDKDGVERTFPIKPMIIKLSGDKMTDEEFEPIKDWETQLYQFQIRILLRVISPAGLEAMSNYISSLVRNPDKELMDILKDYSTMKEFRKEEAFANLLKEQISKWTAQRKTTLKELTWHEKFFLSFIVKKQFLTEKEKKQFDRYKNALSVFVHALAKAKTLGNDAVNTTPEDCIKLAVAFDEEKKKEAARKAERARKTSKNTKTSPLEAAQMQNFRELIVQIEEDLKSEDEEKKKEAGEFLKTVLRIIDLYYGEDSVFDILKKGSNETVEQFQERVEARKTELSKDGNEWNTETNLRGEVKFYYITENKKKTYSFVQKIKAAQGIAPKTLIRIANANRKRLLGFQRTFLTIREDVKGKNAAALSNLLKAKNLLGYAIEGIREIQNKLEAGYNTGITVNLSVEERIDYNALENKLLNIQRETIALLATERTPEDRALLTQLKVNVEIVLSQLASKNSDKGYSSTPLSFEDIALLIDFFEDNTNPPIVVQIRKSQFLKGVEKLNNLYANKKAQEEEFKEVSNKIRMRTSFEEILPTRITLKEDDSNVVTDVVTPFQEAQNTEVVSEENEVGENAEVIVPSSQDVVTSYEEIEVKKADIERRRQEEISNQIEDAINIRNSKTKDELDKSLMKAFQEETTIKALNTAGMMLDKDITVKYYNKDYSFKNEVADAIESTQKNQISKINAKYDAELKELEEQVSKPKIPATSTQSEIEAANVEVGKEDLTEEQKQFLANFPKAAASSSIVTVFNHVIGKIGSKYQNYSFENGVFTVLKRGRPVDLANEVNEFIDEFNNLKMLRADVELPVGELITLEEFKARAKRYMPDISDEQLHALHQDILQELAGGVSVRGMVRGLDVFVELEDGKVRANVVKHELFHRIFGYYLQGVDKQRLYEAYVELYGETPSRMEWEEILTRKFQTFPDLKSRPKNFLYRLYLKVMKFLNLINDYDYEINKLFTEIEQGKHSVILSPEESFWGSSREEPRFYEGDIQKDYGTVETFMAAKRSLHYFIAELTGNIIKVNRLGEFVQLSGTESNLGNLSNEELFVKVITHIRDENNQDEGFKILREKFKGFKLNKKENQEEQRLFTSMMRVFIPDFQLPFSSAQAIAASTQEVMGEEEEVTIDTELETSKGLKSHIERKENISYEDSANILTKIFLNTFVFVSSNGRKILVEPNFAYVKSVQILNGLNFNQQNSDTRSFEEFLSAQIDAAVIKEGNNALTKAIGERIKIIIKKASTPVAPESPVVFLNPNTAALPNYDAISAFLKDSEYSEKEAEELFLKFEEIAYEERFKIVDGQNILKTETELLRRQLELPNGKRVTLFHINRRAGRTYADFFQDVGTNILDAESAKKDFQRAWNRDLLASLHVSLVSLRERAPYTYVKEKNYGVAVLKYFPTVMLSVDQRIKEDIKNLFADVEKRAALSEAFRDVFGNALVLADFADATMFGKSNEEHQKNRNSTYYFASSVLNELATQEKFNAYVDSLPLEQREKTTFESYIKAAFKKAMEDEIKSHELLKKDTGLTEKEVIAKTKIEKRIKGFVKHLMPKVTNNSLLEAKFEEMRKVDLNALKFLAKANLAYLSIKGKTIPLTIPALEKATKYVTELGAGAPSISYSQMLPEMLVRLLGFSDPVFTAEDVDKISFFGFSLIRTYSQESDERQTAPKVLTEKTFKKNKKSKKSSTSAVEEESNEKITGQNVENGEGIINFETEEDTEEFPELITVQLSRNHAQDLNRLARVLSKSNDFIRESTYRGSDGKKNYNFTLSSSAHRNARALIPRTAENFPLPKHFDFPFYKANPLQKDMFRPIAMQEHDKSREKDRHTEYKSETISQYWERNFVGGFLSTLFSDRAEVVEFLDPAEDRPSLIALRFNMLNEEQLKNLYAGLLHQLTLRPEKLPTSTVYNSKSLINLEKLETLLNADKDLLEDLKKKVTEQESFLVNNYDIQAIINKFKNKEGSNFAELTDKEYKVMAEYLMVMFEEDAAAIAKEMLMASKFDLPGNMQTLTKHLGKYGLSQEAINYFDRGGDRDGDAFRIKRTYGEALNFESPDVIALHNALTDIVKLWLRHAYPHNYLAQQLISGDVAHTKSSQDRLKRLGGSHAPGSVGLISSDFHVPKTFKTAVIEELQGDMFSALAEFEKLGKYPVKDGVSPFNALDGSAFMLPERLEMLQRMFGEASQPTSLVKSAHYEIREKEIILVKSNTTVLSKAFIEAKNMPGEDIVREKLKNFVANLRALGVDEAIPPSSLKIGERKPIPIAKLLNGRLTEKEIQDFSQTSVLTLSNDEYKIQLDPVHVTEEAITNPSQLPYFLNIMEQSVEEAGAIYESMAELYDLSLEETLPKFSDLEKIKAQVIKKVKGNNASDYIELLNSGADINYPMIGVRTLNNAIASFSKSTVELKFSGGKMVLVPDLGIERRVDKKKRRLKPVIDDKGLLYYEALLPRYMEKYVHLGDIFGVRIPTTEIHSATPLRIVGFYDNNGTNGIVVPYELIKVTGADFDVDSMFVIRPESISDRAGLRLLLHQKFSSYKEQLVDNWKNLEKAAFTLLTIERNKEELMNLQNYKDAAPEGGEDRRYTRVFNWKNKSKTSMSTSLAQLDLELEKTKAEMIEMFKNSISEVTTYDEKIENLEKTLEQGRGKKIENELKRTIKNRNALFETPVNELIEGIKNLPSNFAGIIVDENKRKTFDEAALSALKQEISETSDEVLKKLLKSKLKVMLKNKIFVNYMQVLQKPQTRGRMLSPISTDAFNKKGENFKNDGLYAEGTVNRYIQDLKLNQFLKDKGLNREDIDAATIKKITTLLKEYDLSNPLDKARAYRSVFDGADLTGIFANFAKSLAYEIRSGLAIGTSTKIGTFNVSLNKIQTEYLSKLLELESELITELSKQLKREKVPDKLLRKRLSIVRNHIDLVLANVKSTDEEATLTTFERRFFELDKDHVRTAPTIKSFLGIDTTQLVGLTDELKVWEVIDSLVNAAIDNLKEQILSIINANKITAEAIAASVALGLDINTTALIFNQDIIKELQFQHSSALKAMLIKQVGKEAYEGLIKSMKEANVDSNIVGIMETYFEEVEKSPVNKVERTEEKTEEKTERLIATEIVKVSADVSNTQDGENVVPEEVDERENEVDILELLDNNTALFGKMKSSEQREKEEKGRKFPFLTVQELEDNFGKEGTPLFRLKVLMLFSKLAKIGSDINSLALAIGSLKSIPADAIKVQRMLENMEKFRNNKELLGEDIYETLPHVKAATNVLSTLNSEVFEKYFYRFSKIFKEEIVRRVRAEGIKLNSSDTIIDESLVSNEFFNYALTNELSNVYETPEGESKPLQITVTFKSGQNEIHKTYTGTAAYTYLVSEELLKIKNDYTAAKKQAEQDKVPFKTNFLLEGLEISQNIYGSYNVRFTLGVNLTDISVAQLKEAVNAIPTGWNPETKEFASTITSPELMKKLFHISVITNGMSAGQNTFNKGLPTILHKEASIRLGNRLKTLKENPEKFRAEAERFLFHLAAKYPHALPFVTKNMGTLQFTEVASATGDTNRIYDGIFTTEDKTVNFHYDLSFEVKDIDSMPRFIQTGKYKTAYVLIFSHSTEGEEGTKPKNFAYYKKLPKNRLYNINKVEEVAPIGDTLFTQEEYFRTDVPYFKEDAFSVDSDGFVTIYSAKIKEQAYADTFFLSKNSVPDNTDRILVEKVGEKFKISEKPALVITESFKYQLEAELEHLLFSKKENKLIKKEEFAAYEGLVTLLNEELKKIGVVFYNTETKESNPAMGIIRLKDVVVDREAFKTIEVTDFQLPKEGLDKFSLFSRVFLNSALNQEQTEENADTEEDCQGE